MNKRGQFYIFVAILLITYAFAITRPTVSPKPPVSSFKSLYQNFISETPSVINNAIFTSGNVSEAYEDFVDTFIGFAKTKSPNFGLVYALVDGSKLVVANRLPDAVNVTLSGVNRTLSPHQVLTTDRVGSFDMNVNNVPYAFSLDDTTAQVKALFRQEDKTEVRVFVYK